MDGDAVKRRWEREQVLLGLARDTSAASFAAGGLGALAVEPTVRIAVLPGDPSAQAVGPVDPTTVIPQVLTLPDGRQVAYHQVVRGTSSGFVGYSPSGDESRWLSYAAVHWHGGVDFFLGREGGREWTVASGSRGRMVFLHKSVGWMWGAFSLQRQIIDRFRITGPFRVILGAADTSGALLANLGAGWQEPGPGNLFGQPGAVEPTVLLVEDFAEWPDEEGTEELALRFGARLDLAFGGSGERHLDQAGPKAGKFNPRW